MRTPSRRGAALCWSALIPVITAGCRPSCWPSWTSSETTRFTQPRGQQVPQRPGSFLVHGDNAGAGDMRVEHHRPVIKLIHHQVGEADRTPMHLTRCRDRLTDTSDRMIAPGRAPTNYARAPLASLAAIPDGGCQLSLVTGPISPRASTVGKVPSLVRYLPIALVPADPPQTHRRPTADAHGDGACAGCEEFPYSHQARRRDGIPTPYPSPAAGQHLVCAISVPLPPVNHGQQRSLVTRPDHRSRPLTAQWAQPSKLGLAHNSCFKIMPSPCRETSARRRSLTNTAHCPRRSSLV